MTEPPSTTRLKLGTFDSGDGTCYELFSIVISISSVFNPFIESEAIMWTRRAVILPMWFFIFWAPAVHAATAKPVVIFTPMGGEFFVVGTTQKVRLDPKTRNKMVTIELSTDGGTTFPTQLGVINNTEKDKTKHNVLSFVVPNLPSGNCVIRVTDGSMETRSPGFSIGTANVADADAKFVTKSDADAKFVAKTDADTTFLAKTDADAKFVAKTDADAKFVAKTDADAKFVMKAGDTMSGLLAFNFAGPALSLLGGPVNYRLNSDGNGFAIQEADTGSTTSRISISANSDVKLGAGGGFIVTGSGTAHFNGGMQFNAFTTSAATLTASSNTCVIFCNTNSNSVAVTIPAPTTAPTGTVYIIKKINANNTVTITPATGTIEGAVSISMTANNDFRYLISGGSNGWFIIGK